MNQTHEHYNIIDVTIDMILVGIRQTTVTIIFIASAFIALTDSTP